MTDEHDDDFVDEEGAWIDAVLALRASDDPGERFVGELADIESLPLLAMLRRTGPQEWGA